jgi:vacuolar-type H+-ATPase subunit D/Vma8
MEADRLSYSFGVKVNIGNFQNVDLHISYSSDVKSDESLDNAFKRIKKYVEKRIEAEVEQVGTDFINREF